METSESDFSKDLLLLMLQEYELFVDSFRLACRKFKGNKESAQFAKTMGFESGREYDEIMFLREITHTVNALNDMGDIVRLYSKSPDAAAAARLSVLLIPIRYSGGSRFYAILIFRKHSISSDCHICSMITYAEMRSLKGKTIIAKGSVRKKGKKWYYRFYVEDASGNLVQKARNSLQRLTTSRLGNCWTFGRKKN